MLYSAYMGAVFAAYFTMMVPRSVPLHTHHHAPPRTTLRAHTTQCTGSVGATKRPWLLLGKR